MARTDNPYSTVYAFFAAHNLPAYRGDWRLTEHVLGEIQGLPGSRGHLAITNGIECMIVMLDGRLFRGHLNWFVPDVVPTAEARSKKPQDQKLNLMLLNF